MCTVSNVGDGWRDTFPSRFPFVPVNPITPHPFIPYLPPEVTREEFEALKNEMEELKKLLIAAKKYDEATGQKDCEMEEKISLIKQIATLVGVKMDDVFPDADKQTST